MTLLLIIVALRYTKGVLRDEISRFFHLWFRKQNGCWRLCFEKYLWFNKTLGTVWNRSRVNAILWEQFQAVPLSSIWNGSNKSRVNAPSLRSNTISGTLSICFLHQCVFIYKASMNPNYGGFDVLGLRLRWIYRQNTALIWKFSKHLLMYLLPHEPQHSWITRPRGHPLSHWSSFFAFKKAVTWSIMMSWIYIFFVFITLRLK